MPDDLQRYRTRRDLEASPEPPGEPRPAVPKGPATDPRDEQLAVPYQNLTADHDGEEVPVSRAVDEVGDDGGTGS